MSSSGKPGAVVIGGYANALEVVRALAAHGVPVAVVATKPFDIAHYSRDTTEWRRLPDLHAQPDSLLELLERESSRWRGWALFPTNDHALGVIARNGDLLARSYRLTTGDWSVVRSLLHKDDTYRIAGQLGVDVPHIYGYAADLPRFEQDVRYPVVVKPVESYHFAEQFDCKLFVAHNAAELTTCRAAVGDAGLSAQVMDCVPGGDDQIYTYCVFMGTAGEPLAGVTARKLRQSPPLYGVARVAETVPDNAHLREAAVELLRRVGFRGMADVQFKLDPRDGRFRLMEVNGRAVLYSALTRKAGVDLAYMAWTDAVEGPPAKARPNGWRGVWIHLHADVLHSLFSHRLEEVTLRQYLAPYARPKTFAVWSVRDPKPFLVQWSRTVREAAVGAWRGDLRTRAEAKSIAASPLSSMIDRSR